MSRAIPAIEPATQAEIDVEVIYALPQQQRLLSVRLLADSTVADAVQKSGVLQQHPDLLDEPLPWFRRVGVFGKQCEVSRKLQTGDRVEIYRSLLIDPKQARRQRASASSA
jgi:putative ubiquitin-RnfH superfamily antitoxin RatB of RatAB toxin-antitoxin module